MKEKISYIINHIIPITREEINERINYYDDDNPLKKEFLNGITIEEATNKILELMSKSDDILNEIKRERDFEYETKLRNSLTDVYNEIIRAKSIHKKDFNSTHEAYAVILEEMDELWEEVKKNPKKEGYSKEKMREEAVQTVAMLLRMITELL